MCAEKAGEKKILVGLPQKISKNKSYSNLFYVLTYRIFYVKVYCLFVY